MEISNRWIFKFNDNNRKYFYLIIGCVWVYRIYQPVFDVAQKENKEGTPNEQYCNKTVYTFAFWLITAAYIFLGLFTSCICCFSIISVILKNEYWREVIFSDSWSKSHQRGDLSDNKSIKQLPWISQKKQTHRCCYILYKFC